MDLPEYQSEHLDRSPLVLVAAQVTFEEVASEVDHRQAREIQRLVGPDWTSLQSAPQVRATLTPSGPVTEKQRQAYRIATRDGSWSLVVNPDSFILETRQYDGWEEMRSRLESSLAAVQEVFDPAQALRLGLRYIDQVPMPPESSSWRELIQDSLLGLAADDRFADSIVGGEHRHLLRITDEVRCLLRHGPQFVEDESPQWYVLDYDLFREGTYSFDVGDVCSTYEILHASAGSLFRMSITDRLFMWLKGGA